MTKEQAKALVPIMEAWTKGKIIQVWTDSKWADCACQNEISFEHSLECKFRIKPEPSLREWRTEDVNPEWLLRHKTWERTWTRICELHVHGITVLSSGILRTIPFKELLKEWEYCSPPNGWLPCGILDPQE